MEKKIIGSFYEKELQKTNQNNLELKKILSTKGNIESKGIDKRSYKMSQYFPSYRISGRNIKVELHLSSYATKPDLKNVTHVDVNSFASKTANLKTEVNKTDTSS